MSLRRTDSLYVRVARTILTLFCCSAVSMPVIHAANCTNTPVTWTVYKSYTDPATGLTVTPNLTGDGVTTDGAGNSVYSASIFNCSQTHTPSYDAVLQTAKGRSFQVNLGVPLGNAYATTPPSSILTGDLLNVSDIQWCQNNGMANGCTFYTRLTTALSGPNRTTYHLRMENPTSVPVTSWMPDATANCPYATSQVQVVFTPGFLSPGGKDTYVVTPVLQGSNTGSGWIAPPIAGGCPTATLPSGMWPAAIGVLVLDGAGNTNNYGQYSVPFKFVIQKQ